MESGKDQFSYLLTGMKHTGKSSHGKALAARLGLPFFDLDDEILRVYHLQGGREESIRNLYRNQGKERFQALEALASRELVRYIDQLGSSIVVASGGGLADNWQAYNAFLQSKNHFFLLHLTLPEDILFKRIISGGIPPFLSGSGGEVEAKEKFHALYLRREDTYRSQADCVLSLDDAPFEENSRLILQTCLSIT